MSENTLDRNILSYLNSLPECYARKTHGNQFSSGWLDIMACHKGRTIVIENKTRRKKPTPLQAAEMQKWAKAGALTLVAWKLEDVSEVVK